jgi:putative transposase
MKEEGVADFTWQIGYGAFSVSSSKLKTVTNYISNQKEHHKRRTYQEEIEEFFKEYGMSEYDVKYFFD